VYGDQKQARGYRFYAWTSLLSLPIGLVLLLISPAVLVVDPDRRRLLALLMNHWLRGTTRQFFPVTATGLENIPPPQQPVVYVANHNSFLDIFALAWLSRPDSVGVLDQEVALKFLSKQQIFMIPWVGWLMSLTGQVKLDRKARTEGRDVLGDARAKLRAGASVVVFAEGTRSRTGQLGEFKIGAFKLAVEEGVPLVPVTIQGTFALTERPQTALGTSIINTDEFSMGHGEVSVQVHPAISPQGRSIEELRGSTRAVIEKALASGCCISD